MTAVAANPNSKVPMLNPRDPRVAALLDAGTVAPLHHADSNSVYAVRGQIDGVTVIVYCTDATKMGGAMGTQGCRHIVEAIDVAIRERCPVIGLWHYRRRTAFRRSRSPRCGRKRVPRDGPRFWAHPADLRGARPSRRRRGLRPALTDIVIMTLTGRVFVTGPDVVGSVTGKQIDQEDLGGAEAHGKKSGVVHILAEALATAPADRGSHGNIPL